jgi:hypothetical protein
MGLFSGIKHIVGGLTGATAAHAAKDAAQAQQEAIQKAIGQYNSDYTGQQNLWNPYINFGSSAMGGINALNSGDFSGFANSPDFLAAMKYGTAAVDAKAGALGDLFAGSRATALQQKGQDTASQYLGQYRNSLFNQLNYGQNATNALSNQLWNKTQGVANAQMGIGNAQAGGMIGAANSWGQGAANLANLGSSIASGGFGGFGGGGNFLSSLFKSGGASGYGGGFMPRVDTVG